MSLPLSTNVRRMSFRVLTAAISLFLAAPADWAQQPPTTRQVLDELGIDTAIESLHAALDDKRPNVRAVAAGEIISRKLPEAANWIAAAGATERDPKVLLSFGRMLTSISDPRGTPFTLRVCHANTFDLGIRVQSLRELGARADRECIDAIFTNVSHCSPQEIAAVLEFILANPVLVHDIAPLKDVIASGARSSVPPVRELAVRSALATKPQGIIGFLQDALNREQDPNTRRYFENAVDALSASDKE